MSETLPSSGMRLKVAAFALAWAVFSVLWFAAAGLGSKYGLWDWTFGLGQMVGNVGAGYGRFIVGIGAVLAIVALIYGVTKAPRVRPVMLSLAAILIMAFVGGRWFGFQLTALSLPPIAQAATDWEDPVPFSSNLMNARLMGTCDKNGNGEIDGEAEADCAPNVVEDNPVVALSRGAAERWPGFDGKTVAQVQEDAEMDPTLAGKDAADKAYPPMNTLVVDMDQTQAFDIALEMVRDRQWHIVGANHDAGRIEATVTTQWFGFKDDIALRILENEQGQTELDMRSVSRVGLSDLGANSRRVASFMYDLEREIAAAQ